MREKKYGNFSIGQIIKMKVDFLGRDLFCDTNFCEYERNISWSNYIDKTYNGERLNLENIQFFDNRLNYIVCKILKYTKMESTDDKKELKEFGGFIFLFFINFFKKLLANSKEVFSGSFTQQEIFQYSFFLHTQEKTGSKLVMGKYVSGYRSQKSIPVIVRKILKKFFVKNTAGYYEISMEKPNNEIRNAFKKADKKLEVLKQIVDTNRKNSLKFPSTSWNILHLLLTDNTIFEGISNDDAKNYIDSYLSYYFLKHFENIVKEFISDTLMTELIDTVLDSTKYRILSVDSENSAITDKLKKIAFSKSEYAIYENLSIRSGKLESDFFYYGRNSSDEIKASLDYDQNYTYASAIVSKINSILYKNSQYLFVCRNINEAKEAFYLEKLANSNYTGKTDSFFYNWYKGVISYALNKFYSSDLNIAVEAFACAFNDYKYFAGNYLKEFCEMYMFVLLQEWKTTKKTGKIKDLWQFSFAQNIVLECYKEFKNTDFEDPYINHDELLIVLWNSGDDILSISNITGLETQDVRQILRKNDKFLTRKDEYEMSRYIHQWEEDEMYDDADF